MVSSRRTSLLSLLIPNAKNTLMSGPSRPCVAWKRVTRARGMGVIIEAKIPTCAEYHRQLRQTRPGSTCPAIPVHSTNPGIPKRVPIRLLSNTLLPLTKLPVRGTVRTSRNCNPARVAFPLPTSELVAMGNRSNGSFPVFPMAIWQLARYPLPVGTTRN